MSSSSRPHILLVLLLAAAMAAPAGPARGEALSDITLRMLSEVKRIRGLEAISTVAVGQRTPESLRALLHKRITEEYTPGQLKALQRLLALTGLIPADYDLVNRYVALLASQALGFYDFKSETFFLSTAAEPALGAAVVLHELTHALQDQHFRIYERLKALKDDEDARTALQALIEGEATAVMLELALEPSGRRFYTLPEGELAAQLEGQQDAFKGEPPVMRDFLYFPYEAGLPFMRAVRRRRPWSGVDEIYNSPPASTEQVLHPERYLVRRDHPRPVRWPELARTLPRRWKKLDANTLGELGAYLLLKPFTNDDGEAREAAAGWGGDRYLVLEDRRSGRAVALVAIAWDTERDAEEFAEALRRAAASRSPGGSVKPGPGGKGWVARQDQGLTYIERKVDRVLVLEGVQTEELGEFIGLGWKASASPPPPSGAPPTEGLARREMYRRRAETLWKQGLPKEAAEAARRALGLSDDDTEALYLLGAILASDESTLADGMTYLTQAVNRDTSLGPALLEMGSLLSGLELQGEARAQLAQAHAIMPDHPGAALAYATVLLEGGEVEEAAEALKPWSSATTRDPKILTLLGRVALARGDFQGARRYLTSALALAPSSAARLALGKLEKREGNHRAAEENFRKASDLDKARAAPRVALGDLYRDQGLMAEAAKTYQAAAALDPYDPIPSTSMGQLALAQGDYKTAEAWYNQALAADPRWRPALGGLETVFLKDGRSTKRLEALLSRPRTLEASTRRALRAGRRCLERGLLRRARQQFETASRLDKDHPGVWAGLGLVHEQEERGEMAKVAYLRALGSPDPLPLADQDRLFRWIAERRIPEASDAVLKRFLNAKIEAERQRAALTLGALGDRRVVPLLLNHLDSGSPPIQAALAEALGRLGDPAAAPSLERLGARTQDPDVASAVQRALARLGAQKAP